MAREGEMQNGGGSGAGAWGAGEGHGRGLPVGLQPEEIRRRLDAASREIVSFVRRHPLESLAGALVLGFFAGRLVSRRF